MDREQSPPPAASGSRAPYAPGPRDYSPPRRRSPPPARRFSRSPPRSPKRYGSNYDNYPPQPPHNSRGGYYAPPPPPGRDYYPPAPRRDNYRRGGDENRRDDFRREDYGRERGRYAHDRRGDDHYYGGRRPPRAPAPPREPNPNPSRVLGVFGLSTQTREQDLEDLFREFGAVERVSLVYDRRSHTSRGFGFIYFSTQEAADMALSKTNGISFQGRQIRVDYSATEKPHEPTPGRYMGERPRSPVRGRYYEDRRRSRSPPRYPPSNTRDMSPPPSRPRSHSPSPQGHRSPPRANW